MQRRVHFRSACEDLAGSRTRARRLAALYLAAQAVAPLLPQACLPHRQEASELSVPASRDSAGCRRRLSGNPGARFKVHLHRWLGENQRVQLTCRSADCLNRPLARFRLRAAQDAQDSANNTTSRLPTAGSPASAPVKADRPSPPWRHLIGGGKPRLSAANTSVAAQTSELQQSCGNESLQNTGFWGEMVIIIITGLLIIRPRVCKWDLENGF